MADGVEDGTRELTAKQKKNKKKREAAKRKKQQKQQESENIAAEGDGQLPENEMSPEEKFQQELSWCIEKLELGMLTQKPDKKQASQTIHLVKALKSAKTPLPRKRQIMFSVFGDYRTKMQEDFHRKQQEPTCDPVITIVKASEQRSIFLKTCQSTQKTAEPEVVDSTSTHSTVFTTSDNSFRFNFM